MKLYFQSTHYSSRLKYAVDFLLGDILGFDMIYGDEKVVNREEFPVIHYGEIRPNSAKIFIPAHPILTETGINCPEIIVEQVNGRFAFFFLPSISNTDLPFDVFALTFYLLSRMEEYHPDTDRDNHQRFPAKASVAHKNGFLQDPLIDQWAWELYKLLKKHYLNCPDRSPSYRFQPSIDVDFAWSYLHKGWERTTGDFIKLFLKLRWGRSMKQLNILFGKQKDPYDTYEFLFQLYQKYEVTPLFFMLLANYGGFDKSNPPTNKYFQKLVKEIGENAEVGIHPSYASNNNNTLFFAELELLRNMSSQEVTISRQHFLKLDLPDTYRNLLRAGIKTDHTMGYASEPGFRASTAHPFFWYDLEKDKQTGLKVVPITVMDVTLKNYLKLSPQEAIQNCARLSNTIRKTGGVFSLLWHNSSFSEEMGWEDWTGIYEKVVALAAESKQNNL